MRCIFCKEDSSSSKSIEHIVPESLGNKSYTLSQGIVCDKCNNYFASKVEKKFLEAGAIKSLRFREGVPSKKGRIPTQSGILLPNFPITVFKDSKDRQQRNYLDASEEGLKSIMIENKGELVFPLSEDAPEDIIVSRFLGKIAIEAIASRLQGHPEGLEYIVEEAQFDPIRNHARYGIIKDWPYNIRRIYASDRKIVDSDGNPYQTVFEYDLFSTPNQELYLIIAIFGLELAINVGGPEIEGYIDWLDANNGISPLYSGKNLL